MKVLNLRCAHNHRFEGWFNSDADFTDQGERGLIACPLCDDKAISRLPSAPRLNVNTHRGEPELAPVSGVSEANAQRRWMHAVRELMNKTEDVGDRFPEEARRIHYGEADPKAIRGQTTPQEREALADEGIEVFTLPIDLPPKTPLQ
jgi:hypothetical protein